MTFIKADNAPVNQLIQVDERLKGLKVRLKCTSNCNNHILDDSLHQVIQQSRINQTKHTFDRRWITSCLGAAIYSALTAEHRLLVVELNLCCNTLTGAGVDKRLRRQPHAAGLNAVA